jgi:hypothetical protein
MSKSKGKIRLCRRGKGTRARGLNWQILTVAYVDFVRTFKRSELLNVLSIISNMQEIEIKVTSLELGNLIKLEKGNYETTRQNLGTTKWMRKDLH